jgi:hypothetical protein
MFSLRAFVDGQFQGFPLRSAASRYNAARGLSLIPEPFLQLAVALGLGLLVGLQRERVDSAIAGIRTFALITVLGTVMAQLGQAFGGWVVAVGLAASAVLVVSGNLARLPKGEADPGQTTEFTALVMYGVGALVVMGPMAVPVVLAGAVAVLLQFKEELHRFAGRLGEGTSRRSCNSSSWLWSSCRCCRTVRSGRTGCSTPTRSGEWWCSSSACRSPGMWRTSCSGRMRGPR